jgi:hypothetical protein
VLNEHFEEDGASVCRAACQLGCEGIVSKRLGSPYLASGDQAAMNTSSISGHYRRPLSPLMVQRALQRDEALTRASGEALVVARSYAVSHSTISRLAGFEVA